MRRDLLASLALLVVVAAPAHAAGAAFAVCAAAAHGATFPLLHCYAIELKASEEAMASALTKAERATRDPKTLDFLERSQSAWSDYRDAWCEARVPRSGSLARIELMACRLAETQRRMAELRALIR